MTRQAPVLVVGIVLITVVVAIFVGGAPAAGAVLLVGSLVAAGSMLLVRGESAEVARRGNRDATQFLGTLVLGGIFVRLLLAVGLRETGFNMVLGGDEGTFLTNASVFASWLDGTFFAPFQDRFASTTQVGYFVFVGTLFHVFGPIAYIPLVINCVLGALCAIPAYRMAAAIGGRTAGRVAAVLVSFFPSLVLWSCLVVRDAPTFLLVLLCALLGERLLRAPSIGRLLLLLACLALLATLRTYIFLLLGGAIVVGFVVTGIRRPGRAFTVAAVSALAMVLLVRAGLGAELLTDLNLERVDEQRRLNALAGRSAIDVGGYDLSSPGGALAYLPIGLSYFLLAPFPWQLGGRQVLAAPDMLLWYAALPFVVLGARQALRRSRSVATVPLIAAGAISVLYALVEGNVGIIVRHRAQVLVLLLPYAAVGFARFRAKSARRRRRESERLADARRVDPVRSVSP